MDAKLTLKLDRDAIERARKYARSRHMSLSKMVEHFFMLVSDDDHAPALPLSPLVRELSGIIKEEQGVEGSEPCEQYLTKKYS